MLDHNNSNTDTGGADAAAADAMSEPESVANSAASSAAGGLFDEPPFSSGKRDRLRGGTKPGGTMEPAEFNLRRVLDVEPILAEFRAKDELASELRRSQSTLDQWEVLGIGWPRMVIGRTILYRRASTQRCLAAQERQNSRSARAAA
jgi:hypothetical protein